MEQYHVLKWKADGRGGWAGPELVDHAEDLSEAEAVYKEALGGEGLRRGEATLRIEIVKSLRRRDFSPDKPG